MGSMSHFHKMTATWKMKVPWETNLHENSFCVWTAVNTEAQISYSRPSSSSLALFKFSQSLVRLQDSVFHLSIWGLETCARVCTKSAAAPGRGMPKWQMIGINLATSHSSHTDASFSTHSTLPQDLFCSLCAEMDSSLHPKILLSVSFRS